MIQTEYDKQALDFINKTGLKIIKKFTGNRSYFPDDKEKNIYRDTYKITFIKNKSKYSFDYGDSIHNSQLRMQSKRYKNDCHAFGMSLEKPANYKEPSDYDILACLEKYDPESLENFADNFGYDLNTDSITELSHIKRIYNTCQKQYDNLNYLFSEEEMEELREIQ
jgi:hypothetical protein